MSLLPFDVVSLIVSYVRPSDIAAVSRLSKLFKTIFDKELIWTGIASKLKIPISSTENMKDKVKAVVLRVYSIAKQIDKSAEKFQIFPLEDTWSKIEKEIHGAHAKLLFKLIQSKELKDEDFLELIWKQLIASFECSKVVSAAQVSLLKAIIRELCSANKCHLIEPCIVLLAKSPSCKIFIQSLHSLYFINPLLILSDDIISLFTAVSTENERVVLASDATELDLKSFLEHVRHRATPAVNYFMRQCQHRMYETLYLKIAKELIVRTDFDIDPDVVFPN